MSGEIAPGDASALKATLQNAATQLANGNNAAGVNQLEAFQRTVTSMVRSGRLSAQTGQALIDAAARIIRQA